jgi:hypothetical protein
MAPGLEPVLVSGQNGAHHRLVIAEQADDIETRQRGEDALEHAGAIRAAIDIVPKIYQDIRPGAFAARDILLDHVEQPVEQIEPAMDIADGIEATARRWARTRPG